MSMYGLTGENAFHEFPTLVPSIAMYVACVDHVLFPVYSFVSDSSWILSLIVYSQSSLSADDFLGKVCPVYMLLCW